MKNKDVSKILYQIADYLEIDKAQFKPYAYQKAAISVENLEEDVEEIYKKGGIKALKEISGVGESIAEKIEEYLKTGKVKYLEQFKKKLPMNLEELSRVEGMGPKRAEILFKKLDIRNLRDLEKAAKARKIAPLFGFGAKTEKNILEGVAFLKKGKGRFLLGEIYPFVDEISEKLKKIKEVKKFSIAGSLRRMKETIGDIDFLVVCSGKSAAARRAAADKTMDFFAALPGVERVLAKGGTKTSVRISDGFDVDARVVPEESYGAALQYFTGSKEHNIAVRKIAIDKGLKLSEYGLFTLPNFSKKNLGGFRGSKPRRKSFGFLRGKMLAGKTEEEIYEKLGMQWMPPEIRENQGEIQFALERKIPKLVELSDIKGDLHCHSNWNGGANSIEEIARAGQKMGYEYIGIADHTKFLRIENGLNERQLLQQRKEIDKINSKFKIQNSKFRIFHGCEANILADGSIDIKDEVLAKLDYVIAGVHSSMKMPKEKMTERIIKAMRNPHIDIISHPTGRLLQRRDEYQIDFDKILKVAKETGTILEINSCPERLDLNDQNIRRAKEAGVKMVINTDSHQKDQLRFIEYGIAQARRGWAEKSDIINIHPATDLLKFFN